MFKSVFFCIGVCLMIGFTSCSGTNSKPLSIRFSSDSTKIVFDHVDRAGLLEFKNSNEGDSVLKNLISVVRTPSERDSLSREEPIEGTILLTDSNLVFVPAKPFVRGYDYLVIAHLNLKFGGAEEIAKGKLNLGLKPVQQLLTR